VFEELETFVPVKINTILKQEVKKEAVDIADTVKQLNAISHSNNDTSNQTGFYEIKDQADSHFKVKVFSLEYMLQPNTNHKFVDFLKKVKHNISKHFNKAYID